MNKRNGKIGFILVCIGCVLLLFFAVAFNVQNQTIPEVFEVPVVLLIFIFTAMGWYTLGLAASDRSE